MVLGIENRTENWKTARHFAPFFERCSVHFVHKLVDTAEIDGQSVQLELFWRGMRDYFQKCQTRKGLKLSREDKANKIRESYMVLFPDLRNQIQKYIEGSKGFRDLDNGEKNYNPNHPSLYDNVYNTEIDVVMESSHHLFIGEAKHQTGFHANGSLVLVHQLIRQYVMTKILVHLEGGDKEVVPFVVGGNEKQHQIKFMVKQGWMKRKHVFSWQDITEITV